MAVINLESKECHYFPDYPEAMQFLRGKNGRWYIATLACEDWKEVDWEGMICTVDEW